MKRNRAYSSSCSQVILSISTLFVTIHSFAAENRKNITKTFILGFKVISVDTCLLYTSDAADE